MGHLVIPQLLKEDEPMPLDGSERILDSGREMVAFHHPLLVMDYLSVIEWIAKCFQEYGPKANIFPNFGSMFPHEKYRGVNRIGF